MHKSRQQNLLGLSKSGEGKFVFFYSFFVPLKSVKFYLKSFQPKIQFGVALLSVKNNI